MPKSAELSDWPRVFSSVMNLGLLLW